MTNFLSTFFRTPRKLVFRRIAFQIHLWLGLVLGLYMLVMSFSGIPLVFQDEMAASAHPHLFRVPDAGGPHVNIDTLTQSVRATYPGRGIWRIYPPTTRRDTYLISVEATGEFRTVFAHPRTGAILGELPREGFMSSMRNIHANLASGDTGRMVNCTLGIVALVLFATGLVVWWPGVSRWWRALGVRRHESWQVTTRHLHGAIGIWMFAFLMMFAVTGALYYYGGTFFRILHRVSPLTNPPTVRSAPPTDASGPPASHARLIEQAQAASPSKNFWALLPPMGQKSSVQVILGPISNDLGRPVWDWDATGTSYVYFDQYSGRLLAQWDLTNPTFADSVRAWLAPLHRGSFGGLGIKVLWAVVGLAPALLVVAGALMWWSRVLRPWLSRRTR